MLRLLGLVAITLHDLAVGMFCEFHPQGGPRHPAKRASLEGIFTPDLFHFNYQCWQQYPQGPADMVGYWAEAQIFGGTVLFEHGESDLEVRCNLRFLSNPLLAITCLSPRLDFLSAITLLVRASSV
jgi:hypothetical protein